MAEQMPPVPEEYRQLNRSLTERILDRAASDPQWKQQLLDDPEAATAELPEIQRLQEIEERIKESAQQAQEETEVAGQVCNWTWYDLSCPYQCLWWTRQWYRTHW